MTARRFAWGVLLLVAVPLPVPAQNPPPLAGGSDIELVERVIGARKAYQAALQELHRFYVRSGDRERAEWAEEELRAFSRVPQAAYRLDLDVPSPMLKPLYNQPEANELYRKAMTYKDRGLGSEYADNQRRAEILLQQVLTEYPQCNKISDAAYQLGELYQSRTFRQYRRAAVYFERCFQWNPNTQFDARLQAAKLYDRQLNDKTRAMELYKLVLEYEADNTRRLEAERRIKDLSGR